MPQITVYLRKEDEDKWKSLEQKSEFLHNALNGIILPEQSKEYKRQSPDSVEFQKLGITTADKFVPKPPDPETGYPCCTKAKPCKHWQWDGVNSQYVNELTGEVKDIL